MSQKWAAVHSGFETSATLSIFCFFHVFLFKETASVQEGARIAQSV